MRDNSSSHPLRVLVVDDLQDQRETLAMLLRAWGHDVCLAKDSPSALEATRTFQLEVVLPDIGMPGMDGYEVAHRLRQQEDFTGFLVALSGYGTQEDKARSREAGFDVRLAKPRDLAELRRLLATAMRANAPAV